MTPVLIRETYGYAAGDDVEIAAGPDGVFVDWSLPTQRGRVFGYGHDLDNLRGVSHVLVVTTGVGVQPAIWEIAQFDRIRRVA